MATLPKTEIIDQNSNPDPVWAAIERDIEDTFGETNLRVLECKLEDSYPSNPDVRVRGAYRIYSVVLGEIVPGQEDLKPKAIVLIYKTYKRGGLLDTGTTAQMSAERETVAIDDLTAQYPELKDLVYAVGDMSESNFTFPKGLQVIGVVKNFLSKLKYQFVVDSPGQTQMLNFFTQVSLGKEARKIKKIDILVQGLQKIEEDLKGKEA